MKKVVLAVVLSTLALPAFAEESEKKATVKILNQSHWEIHHFFLSSSDDDTWGPDQIADNTLERGDSFTLTGIPCDRYDVKLVDEDGDECVVESIDLCADESWKITDKNLLECEGDGE